MHASISEISAAASLTRVEMVSNTVSRRLLSKFRNASETRFDFDYSQSRIWSPPFQPSMFLSSPGNAIVTPNEMLVKLRKLAQLRQRRRYGISFNRFWCFAKKSRGRWCSCAAADQV